MGAALSLPSGRGYAARARERESGSQEQEVSRERERERERSIESPLRRVSGGVARWNHAAAGGLFSVYICRSITLDPVGCRCVGRVSMLRRGRPARGQGNESRNADFRPSPFHSCLLSLSISLLLTDNPCFTLSKRQALWILAKSTGNSHPSSIGCHFSSEVARLDKC